MQLGLIVESAIYAMFQSPFKTGLAVTYSSPFFKLKFVLIINLFFKITLPISR